MYGTLESVFGFKEFRKGQREVIEKILHGESAIAIFATGSGKSLCYQLPALHQENLTLIVSPLLSLMIDQINFLEAKGIPAARLDSTLTKAESLEIIAAAKSGRIKILMVSPERFKNEIFRAHLREMKIDLMVVDEAHAISEWGHNFRPDYLKLPIYCRDYSIKKVLLLTATATPKVIEDMRNQFNIPSSNVVVTGFYRENLDINVIPLHPKSKDNFLADDLKDKIGSSTIVYVTQQKTAERVSQMLNSKGLNSEAYHAGINSEERERIQKSFMSGEKDIIVATIAFGMGIDKSDIRYIYHYNLPKSLENYAQEIGRAGRDGEKSICKVLASKDDLIILKNFIFGDYVEKLSITKFLHEIDRSQDNLFMVKPLQLSKITNIKPLPLKTLLVYLELQGILEPSYSSFNSLQLNFLESEDVVVDVLENNSLGDLTPWFFSRLEKKIKWCHLEVESFIDESQNITRAHLMEILKVLEENNLIELRLKDSYEAFKILSRPNDNPELRDKLFALFISKVTHELKRLDEMVSFFQEEGCLNEKLALYFGEKIPFSKCNHCSFCKTGSIVMESYISSKVEKLKELSPDILLEYRQDLKEFWTPINVAKILSGITLPVVLRCRSLPHFSEFETVDFKEILNIVKEKMISVK